jgi:hypothetical protein
VVFFYSSIPALNHVIQGQTSHCGNASYNFMAPESHSYKMSMLDPEKDYNLARIRTRTCGLASSHGVETALYHLHPKKKAFQRF